MRTLWKDMIAAFMMGMVLPGLLLNAVVTLRQHRTQQTIQITIPTEQVQKQSSMPVLLRSTDGIRLQQDMDHYLTCVLLAEVPASFEPEALKAQAIAARTYARKAWETGGKHGDGSVCGESGCCQAYLSKEAFLMRGGTEADYDKVHKAVMDTSGQCLKYGDELIEATYFSCSGGRTEDAVAVWGTDYPYLQAVDSPGEEQAVWYTDSVSFSLEQFREALDADLEGDPETWFTDICYTSGGGIDTMEVGGKRYTGTQLRSLLGLRSTAFEITATEGAVQITTKGYGHRVGMSQYGAEAMALNGCSCEEILAHYYPGTKLVMICT